MTFDPKTPARPTIDRSEQHDAQVPARKPFAAPCLKRHAPLPAVTAGSVMIG